MRKLINWVIQWNLFFIRDFAEWALRPFGWRLVETTTFLPYGDHVNSYTWERDEHGNKSSPASD